MALSSFSVEWDAHEYEHKERSSDWFWAVGIISVSIAIASIIFGNTIFGILIVVAAFSLSLFINRPPEDIHVIVNEQGITRGKIRYPYSTLSSFWIDVEHPHKKIILKSQKLLMPLIVVPLAGDIDSAKLERTLSKFLAVEYHQMPLVEKILEYLGF